MKNNELKVQLADEQIFNKIYLVRGQKVILDSDLAELYMVEVRTLKQTVRRHLNRFPEDFMFQVTGPEWIRYTKLQQFKIIRTMIEHVISIIIVRSDILILKQIHCF